MNGTVTMPKDAWESPLKREFGYAANQADCFYAADHIFRRWLRTNVNHLMTGWAEELHDQPGFLEFCKWAQLQFLDHMRGMALFLKDNGAHEAVCDFEDGEEKRDYEDTDNSSIEWGDERGKTKDCPHLMFFMNSEFRKPDYPEQWFMLMFTNREQSSDDTASWFAPERPRGATGREAFRDLRAVGRYMLKEVKAADKELREFWAEYAKQYPLTESPEEWRG